MTQYVLWFLACHDPSRIAIRQGMLDVAPMRGTPEQVLSIAQFAVAANAQVTHWEVRYEGLDSITIRMFDTPRDPKQWHELEEAVSYCLGLRAERLGHVAVFRPVEGEELQGSAQVNNVLLHCGGRPVLDVEILPRPRGGTQPRR